MSIIENLFAVLGGGNSIGTSCYYLQVDDCAFLLDCGASIHSQPHLPALSDITNQFLDGLWQLDAVIISHAHFDHFGALPYLTNGDYDLNILCNPITKNLMELQLNELNNWQNIFRSTRQRKQYELQKDRCLTMLKPIAFYKKYETKHYAITLYPAGHIPGAAMIYLETAKHKILYTGDFSKQQDLLCSAYNLPANLPVDILIIEGTHAYGNHHSENQQGYASIASGVIANLAYGLVTVETSNITKGIELARFLEQHLLNSNIVMPDIYLEKTLFPIVDTFEQANFQVYSKYIKPLVHKLTTDRAIIIKRRNSGNIYGKLIDGDMFTLHASSNELVELINSVQATTTLIVHAQPHDNDFISPNINIGNKLCLQTVDHNVYRFK